MSQLLQREGALQELGVEPLTGVDGQGLPAYGSTETVLGRVVQKDEATRGTMIVGASGEEVAVMATIWIDGEEDTLPGDGDRITTEQGLVGIVVESKEGRNLSGDLDHIRIKLSKE